MDESEWLAERFEEHRPRLRAVAYRMLGSLAEADDAVQDAWLRLSRSDAEQIDNLGGWLTTVVARICLNMLRSRNRRAEDAFGVHLPDPVVVPDGDLEPEQEACWPTPSAWPCSSCWTRSRRPSGWRSCCTTCSSCHSRRSRRCVGRTPTAARQLASRARRRVKGAAVPPPDADLARQRQVVDAFFAAARAGDFDGLVRVLDPDVVLRGDFGADRPPVHRTRGGGGVEDGPRAARCAAAPRARQRRAGSGRDPQRTAVLGHGVHRRRRQDHRDRRHRRPRTGRQNRDRRTRAVLATSLAPRPESRGAHSRARASAQ